jgi:glycosyltransferase involved in cell wall biosynthesis
MNNTDISIIIPAYNESATIGDVVNKIKIMHPDAEVIVVNDGSADDTAKAAEEAGAIVFSHPIT